MVSMAAYKSHLNFYCTLTGWAFLCALFSLFFFLQAAKQYKSEDATQPPVLPTAWLTS